jgi:UDP-2,3-diacylglucosamine hydrolase
MINTIDNIKLETGKKIYFASDFHLGAPSLEESIDREKKVIEWLRTVKSNAQHIFILGDIFDFWFEYKYVIPKGFSRLMGEFISIRDDHIPITFFPGNHDMWMFDYFQSEFGISIYKKPSTLIINEKKFMIGHGDGLGPGDRTYKILKRLFENKVCQWAFRWLHPDMGYKLANHYSYKSRQKNLFKDDEFKGEKEWLLQYCRQIESEQHHDYYIFGHRHLPLDIKINEKSRYINIGDWIKAFTYGEYDGREMCLKYFKT